MTNEELVKGLREVADFYEARPELELPSDVRLQVFGAYAKEALQKVLRQVGGCEKDYSGGLLYVRKSFGKVQLEFIASRDRVCERVAVGTKIEPATKEYVIAAQPEREVEVVEWRCGPILEEANR
jgi:hypothetical protein